jgi:acylphosphatase
MKKHLNILVKGKVQGVWYRKSTKDKADELGLFGLVKNMPDGSVYIEAEGNDAPLKSLVEWCNSGPELSRVDNVSVEETTLKHFSSFDILR